MSYNRQVPPFEVITKRPPVRPERLFTVSVFLQFVAAFSGVFLAVMLIVVR
jgi:hypothetical protein